MKRRTFLRSTMAAAASASLPLSRDGLLAAAPYRPAPQVPPDVAAVTGDGERVTIRGRDIAELAGRLRGRLLLSGDAGYEEARQILNPSFDKRPALIAQVTGTADVQTAVDFARDHRGLLLAVKCGGHSLSGKSTCDGGLMIDLSPFRAVRVDPVARRARATGGSLLGAVDHETMAHGLVTPLGTVSHTGVGGLVTGGGFGRLARRFGLAVDNLTAVDVVTADGQLRFANESENADLFWGVRGGGGNFGVVTSFEFRLHPMERQVIGGRLVFPISRARDVLRLCGDYGPEAPDELQMDWGLDYPPGGAEGTAWIGICYSGAPSGVDRALAPIRGLGSALAEEIGPIDYVALQRIGDSSDPRALGSYVKGGFITGMPAGLVSEIVDGLEPDPRRVTSIFFQQSGGAIGRVAPDATAFPQREVQANMLAFTGWPHGQDPSEHIEWIRRYWAALEPYTHGFYVNDLEEDHTAAAIADNYSQNHERLVAVKNRYDPANLFRLNANVEPTARIG